MSTRRPESSAGTVGEGLAGAGAGLDQQRLTLRQRCGDALGHAQLPGPRRVAVEHLLQGTAAAEILREIWHIAR
jgi:hypothetical protein